MISFKELSGFLGIIIPLYFTMAVGFVSVKWLRILTSKQCSGIHRFVKVFAMPFLCFQLISSSNLYAINLRFLAADSLQKIIILTVLFLWKSFTKNGSLEWVITLFTVSSFSSIYNLGLPMVTALYGAEATALITQTAIFQLTIWNNVLIVLYEYRAVETAASVAGRGAVSDDAEAHLVAVVKNSADADGLTSVSAAHGLDSDAAKAVDFQNHTSSTGNIRMTTNVILMLWNRIMSNPMTYATLFGITWSLIAFKYHIKMPTVLDGCFSMFSQPTMALKMFNIGSFMALQENMLDFTIGEAMCVIVVRFLVSPGVAAATSIALGLHGNALHTAIVKSVFPLASSCVVFAKEYNNHANILGPLIPLGLLVAVPMVLSYYILLTVI